MEKLIKVLLGLACVGVFTLAVSTTSRAQNLLYDPGAEQELTAPNPNPTGIQGWSFFGGAGFLTTPNARSGTNVLYAPASGGGYSVPGAFENFAATAGQTFVLSGWVYTPSLLISNSNDFAILQLQFYTGTPPANYGSGTLVGLAIGVNVGTPMGPGPTTVPLPQGVWTYASVTGTAVDVGVNHVGSLSVYLLDINADANATFYFDDMTLTESGSPPPPPFQITSIARQGNDLRITWQTPGGSTNTVQAASPAANGSYSNNFGNLSSPIVVLGSGATSTNFTDVGGGTNQPSRFYRVKMVASASEDDASDPAYSGGWTNGSNGGIGFSPWTLTATGVIGSNTNGYFIDTSTNNAGGATPSIDVSGKSWGIYANNGNFTAAYRTFAEGSLQVGQSLLLSMDNGYLDTGTSDGFVLRNGNTSASPTNYNAGARFEFLYIGNDTSNSYKVVDSGGLTNIGTGFTGTGKRLVFTLNTANTYTLLAIDNASGATNTWSGTLGGSGTVDSIAIYNRNPGSGANANCFFNSLQIIGP